jgi:Domain of unknown function (DUF4261)
LSGEKQAGSEKVGAVIYLRTAQPLRLAAFVSKFHQRSPGLRFTNEGCDGNLTYFGTGDDSHFAIELRHETTPQAVTNSALPSRHWPDAEKDLALHKAYLKIVASSEPDGALTLAFDLTKVIVALLCVTDAIGVCWLNGSVLSGSVVHSSQDFTAIATEMLGGALPPLILWIALHWKPQEHVIHTTGMLQFGAPEILLGQQVHPSPEMVEYFFEVAHYVLTSGKEILAGETMDGPRGLLRIESISGSDPGRRALILVPVQAS